MSTPILAGIDPLREDPSPLHLGAAIAHATGAPLVAVATFIHDAIGNASAGGEIERDLREHATARLAELAAGTGAELVVAGGTSPARILHDLAAERDAALLVVGSTHRGPIGRIAPGSTAERLLAGASCPVALATTELGPGWAIRRIGVGFIDLDEGRDALRGAAALARATGAELKAVTAVEPIDWSASVVVQPYAIPQPDADAGIPAATASLAAALAADADGVEATSDVARAYPAEALAALSAEVDLLVCGSRGYGPLRAVLLGGVTHRLMREARCPVIIVPRGTEQQLERLLEHEATTTG